LRWLETLLVGAWNKPPVFGRLINLPATPFILFAQG